MSVMEFDDDTIALEMSKEFSDVDEDEVFVDDEGGLSSFGFDVKKAEILGEGDFIVVEDEDTAHDLAVAVVTQDLEEEPELFSQSFLESHIDMDKLKAWVYQAVIEDEYAQEIADDDPDRFWDEYENWDLGERPEEDQDLYEEPLSAHVERLQAAIASDRADDPMDYLEDIYGREEAVKQAMDAVGFDVAAAAEDAVRIDGWAHFLSRYDGNYQTTPGGFVYWRDA